MNFSSGKSQKNLCPLPYLLAATYLLLSAGCSSSSTPPPLLPPLEPAIQIASENKKEYQNLPALATINASSLYGSGGTGASIRIAILDETVNATHPDLDEMGKVKIMGEVKVKGKIYSHDPTFDSSNLHGTYIAVLAAGMLDDESERFNIHGVAHDAQIISVPLFNIQKQYCADITLLSIGEAICGLFTNIDIYVQMLEQALEAADIVNVSLGQNIYLGETDTGDTKTLESAKAELAPYIQVLRQDALASADKTIYVTAAGNAGNEQAYKQVNPSITALLPTLDDQIENFLVVGALQAEYEVITPLVLEPGKPAFIADFSQHCGIAKDYCLMAQGEDLAVPGLSASNNNEAMIIDGTSFAAPLVAGGIALLLDTFNGTLGNDEAVARVLATADKTNYDLEDDGLENDTAPNYSDQEIYGQGVLDLQAAVMPQGSMMLTVDNDLNSPANAYRLATTRLHYGPALAGLDNLLPQLNTMTLDSLGAPFQLNGLHHLSTSPSFHFALPSPLPSLHSLFQGKWQLMGAISSDKLQLIASDASKSWQLTFTSGKHPYTDTTTLLADRSWSGLTAPSLARWHSLNLNLAITASSRAHLLNCRRGDEETSRASHRRPNEELMGGQCLLAGYQWQPHSTMTLHLSAGQLQERGSSDLLGLQLSGGWGQLREVNTYISSFSARWQLMASTRLLWLLQTFNSRLEVTNSALLASTHRLSSDSWAVAVEVAVSKKESLSFKLYQPLRVHDGAIHFDLAGSRDRYRQINRYTLTGNPQASGREVRAELNYQMRLGRHSSLRGALGYAHQPLHDPTRDAVSYLQVSLKMGL